MEFFNAPLKVPGLEPPWLATLPLSLRKLSTVRLELPLPGAHRAFALSRQTLLHSHFSTKATSNRLAIEEEQCGAVAESS